MKFIALNELDLCVFTQSENAKSILPKVIGIEGVNLVFAQKIALPKFKDLQKISIWMNGPEGRKSYESKEFKLADCGEKIELIFESKAKRQLKKDILLSKSFSKI